MHKNTWFFEKWRRGGGVVVANREQVIQGTRVWSDEGESFPKYVISETLTLIYITTKVHM